MQNVEESSHHRKEISVILFLTKWILLSNFANFCRDKFGNCHVSNQVGFIEEAKIQPWFHICLEIF